MDVDDDAAERVLVVAVGDGGALRDGDVAEEGVLGELAAALGQHLGRVVHKFHFMGTKFLFSPSGCVKWEENEMPFTYPF